MSMEECRMYPELYPKADQLVKVKVESVDENSGAKVRLLEYGGIQGLVLSSELSKRRIRSMHKVIKAGQEYIVSVIRVDEVKGYVDLSKRKARPADVVQGDAVWTNSKTVHSVMMNVAAHTERTLEEACERMSWPLYEKFGHAYEAFKLALHDPDAAFKDLDITQEERDCLVEHISRRLTKTALRLRARVEVSCFEAQGVNAVRDALVKGHDAATEECPLTIRLIAAPFYSIDTTTTDKPEGTRVLEAAMAIIQKEILDRKGRFQQSAGVEIIGADQDNHETTLKADSSSSGSESEQDETMGGGDELEAAARALKPE